MNTLPSLISTIATPVLLIGTLSALPIKASRYHVHQTYPSAPPALPAIDGHIWVKVSKPTTIKTIAYQLGLSWSELSDLNEQPSSSLMKSGSWLLLAKEHQGNLQHVKSLAEVRHSPPPITSPAPPSSVVKVQAGESIAAIARQHGITLENIRQLNPKLEFNQLKVGTDVRVAVTTRPIMGNSSIHNNGVIWSGGQVNQNSNFYGLEEFIWPTEGVITSGFGWRWGRMHNGLDIANKTGTPIVAAKDGIINFSGWSSGYGNLVEISHSDGSSTRYAHNSRLLVRKGQLVPQGAKISLMGSTGRSTGPHLHFEIRRKGGAATNPISLLPSKNA
ncbi:MAG: peptidoglycan DD-metalloendopeptidase family protein [Prochlorococcus sp.]